jgi:hypothetical protein
LYPIERQNERRTTRGIPIRQRRGQPIFVPGRQRTDLGHDTLMHSGTGHALQPSSIDALDGDPTRLCRAQQSHHSCVVATARDIDPLYTFSVTFKQSLHGVNAVHCL